MSFPDNPFGPSIGASQSVEAGPSHTNEDDKAASGTGTPGSLLPQYMQPIRPANETGTTTPSPSYTPGGSLLVQPGRRNDRPIRHVQWDPESHIVNMEPPVVTGAVPPSPTNTVSRANIDQIDTALERHRSTSRGPTRRRPTLSRQSSPGDDTSGEDYDFRLDRDPPNTTAGMNKVTSAGSGDGVAGMRQEEGRTIQDLLGNAAGDAIANEYIPLGETDGLPSLPQASEDAGDHHDAAKDLVRAHTGKWGVLRRRVRGAGAVERAFSPRDEGKAQTTATEEVSSPRRHHFSLRRHRESVSNEQGDEKFPDLEKQSPTSPKRPRLPPIDIGREHDEYEEPRSPVRRHSGGLPPLPGGGASVLSSLLTLYNQQNYAESTGTSLASSRASSEDEYSTDSSYDRIKKSTSPEVMPVDPSAQPPEENEPQRFISPDHGEEGIIRSPIETVNAADLQPQQSLQLQPGVASPPIDQSPLKVGRRPAATRQNTGASTPGIIGALIKAKDVVEDTIDDADRPDAAKSGAGVFGALLQSVANVSGIATPAASALAPAARRSGFQLNRFSVDDYEPPKTKAWRPPSTPSSRRSSRPASPRSSTAVETGDNSMDSYGKDGKYASDDLKLIQKPSGKMSKGKPQLDLSSLSRLPGAALHSSGVPGALRTAERWIAKTPLTTPPEKLGEYFSRPISDEERRKRERDKEIRRKKKARKARKKQEIFIVQHVAAVLARQQFLMKLARALMMFGSPSHRLETQIQATARVLEINAQVVYMPGVMLISFNDDATHTSETKFLKQSTGIDLGKVLATHNLYWDVIHDRISVDEASKALDVLMTSPVYYNWWQTLFIGSLCSAFITVIGYHGSFIDALMTMPLGATLVAIQMLAAKNDMFSNVFEIAVATVISFVSAALASTKVFCYTALVSGGVVLILPGYIVLTGALELASRNITAGSVRIGYSVIYSLFLGFGISIGAELYTKMTGLQVYGFSQEGDLYSCHSTHENQRWYQVTPSGWWYFLCCPGFAFFLALRNQQPLIAKELPVMTAIAVAGWCANHFSAQAFENRSDMTSAIGAFTVGTLGNIYGRFSHGASFPVTVVGILFQLPSGLANGGIFNFAQASTEGNSNAYSDGFSVAEQLVSVAIGLTVGLFVSAVITNPLGGGRRTGSGIFAF